ncbi:hypothetical protein [Phenylobacterium sp.]|jgi:molybdate transport system ATP-binding protein|uniref:hypothetical protein n=1 Tax=Phenylobacterium sp. TaxID=1871053 RepID=UPI002F42AE9A
MKTFFLATGAAALALCGGTAFAATKHSAHSTMAMSPKEPIPYSQLDAYLSASPKQRASKDWSSGQTAASTGSGTNASATAGSDVRSTPDAKPSAEPSSTGPVNPPASTTPEAAPSTTPPKAPNNGA